MWAVLRTMRLTTKTTQELPLQCERAHQPVLRISLIQISSICGMSRNKSRPQDSNDPTPTPQQAPCTSKSQPSPINGGHPAVTAHPTAAWSWNCLIFLTKLYFLHFHKRYLNLILCAAFFVKWQLNQPWITKFVTKCLYLRVYEELPNPLIFGLVRAWRSGSRVWRTHLHASHLYTVYVKVSVNVSV